MSELAEGSVEVTASRVYPLGAPVVVIGAGACGLTAALAARDAGVDAVVLERDAAPGGSTALSSGFIPAAGTRWQAACGVDDNPALLADDIQAKARGCADPAIVAAVSAAIGPTLEWLSDAHGAPFVLVEGFLYPGHGRPRMHAHPERTGAALHGALLDAAERAGAVVLASAHVHALFADQDGRVHGVSYRRPDGAWETLGCGALVLACNGFGGNPAMVRRRIPEMAGAHYAGHAGNRGDAVAWGAALGADLRDMGAYQGHGSLATPHGVLVTWALMMEGGVQVNAAGERFSNEHDGYSEQAVRLLAQPGGVAWDVFDDRLHELGMTFDDYRRAVNAGALRSGDTPAALAAACGIAPDGLERTLARVAECRRGATIDPFGRCFTATPALAPPYHAIKVTGSLFHTQGGLAIDTEARVLRADGTRLPNLFAGGGAARGVSGPQVDGYLSGNGLLTAIAPGRMAGRAAARLCTDGRRG